jgi:hypothetical protein
VAAPAKAARTSRASFVFLTAISSVKNISPEYG